MSNQSNVAVMPSSSISTRKNSGMVAPLSPDMKNARNRLGNLLHGIRKGDIVVGGDKDDDEQNEANRRGPGRPKRNKRERRILFELRYKPFTIRDNYEHESIYSMMRKYVYGKDDDQISNEPPSPTPTIPTEPVGSQTEESIDLLATKEIYKMPEPLPIEQEVPQMKIAGTFGERLPEDSDPSDLLAEHLDGWKTCRQQHRKIMELREKRFEPSKKLFKIVHDLTQQTTE